MIGHLFFLLDTHDMLADIVLYFINTLWIFVVNVRLYNLYLSDISVL